MNTKNDNLSPLFGIEKFEGSFEKEDSGVTLIPTKTIQEIRNSDALAIYCFLASCANGWKLNAKHLQKHFGWGLEKVYKNLKWLLQEGYLSRTEIREKGRFLSFHYRLHLSRLQTAEKPVDLDLKEPKDHAGIDIPPFTEKPHTVKPHTVNQEAYKTYKLKNIKSINNKPSVDFPKSTTHAATPASEKKAYKNDILFLRFYSAYPNKQKPLIAYKAFCKHKPTPEFVAMLINDVKARKENNWVGRDKSKIPFPATYLNAMEWEGEIFRPEFTDKNKAKFGISRPEDGQTTWS